MRQAFLRMFASMVSTLVVLSGIIVLMNTPAGSANAQPLTPDSCWQEPIA
jgi:hypothetical protein